MIVNLPLMISPNIEKKFNILLCWRSDQQIRNDLSDVKTSTDDNVSIRFFANFFLNLYLKMLLYLPFQHTYCFSEAILCVWQLIVLSILDDLLSVAGELIALLHCTLTNSRFWKSLAQFFFTQKQIKLKRKLFLGILFQRRVAFWCIRHRQPPLRGSEQNVIHVNTAFLHILKFNQSEKSYILWCLGAWRHCTAFSQHFLRIHSLPLNRWHRDDKWILGGELEIKRDQRQKRKQKMRNQNGKLLQITFRINEINFYDKYWLIKGMRKKRNFYLQRAISPGPKR